MTQLESARKRVACQANVQGLRKRDTAFVAVETALTKMMSDPEHKSIESGFGPFAALVLGNAAVTGGADYERALLPVFLLVSDYRAGTASAEQVQGAADDLLVEARKADGRARTILNATLPQGC